MSTKRRMKVIVVHAHEKSEGSRILAVLPDTKRGQARAKAIEIMERRRVGFMSCDDVEREECDVEFP